MSSSIYSFATSFYILKITGNDAAMQGIYLFACGASFLIISLFSGVLCDRFNKAKIMFLCDYAKGALVLASGVVILALGDNQIGQLLFLFVLGILGNIISAIFFPASSSILPFIIGEDQLQQGNSFLQVMNSFLNILGVVLAGVLYATLSFYILLIITGVCYIGSGISEMFIRYEHVQSEEKLTVKEFFKDLGDSFRYLGKMGGLVVIILVALFVNFFFTPVTNNFIPYFIATDITNDANFLFHSFVEPEMWNSILTVAFCLGSLIGAVILSSRSQIEKVAKFLKIMFSISSILLILLAASYFVFTNYLGNNNVFLIIFTCGAFLLGGVISFINIPLGTAIAKNCDKSMLGKVGALMNIGSQGLIPISSLLAGFCIQYFGCSMLLFICSAGFVGTTLMLIFSKKINEI